MSEIKSKQIVKLYIDSLSLELDCIVKYLENNQLVLDYDDKLLRYADYLQSGDHVGAKVYTPSGIIVFDTVVINSFLEGDFIIEYVDTNQKIQRRNYVRVPFETKLEIEKEDKRTVIAKTLDLSGGGIKFQIKDCDIAAFTPKEKVKIFMYMSDEPIINCEAEIVENAFLPENEKALQFTDIVEKERERIIKKTFQLQRRDYKRAKYETKIILQQENKTIIEGKTVDISGNGIKFETNEVRTNYFKDGENLFITLFIDENTPIHARARVIYHDYLPENNYALSITHIAEADRAKITEKIYELQN